MNRDDKKRRNSVLSEFAKRVRQRRHDLDLTQEQLAELSDFHVNFIGGIERGTRNPSLTSLVKLAQALELPLEELISNLRK